MRTPQEWASGRGENPGPREGHCCRALDIGGFDRVWHAPSSQSYASGAPSKFSDYLRARELKGAAAKSLGEAGIPEEESWLLDQGVWEVPYKGQAPSSGVPASVGRRGQKHWLSLTKSGRAVRLIMDSGAGEEPDFTVFSTAETCGPHRDVKGASAAGCLTRTHSGTLRRAQVTKGPLSKPPPEYYTPCPTWQNRISFLVTLAGGSLLASQSAWRYTKVQEFKEI
ncbi:hypothetical protein GWK47_020722 [Chionoecetes opilio]|uniref:Uncharacterized protein n=1 Tax=Chionoecetes opilio TaxID=41210 RepID=A0A8J5CH93_CHIOP|nr:hypothetical protein GWK47_020722 [Chionoecetes opilio]